VACRIETTRRELSSVGRRRSMRIDWSFMVGDGNRTSVNVAPERFPGFGMSGKASWYEGDSSVDSKIV
jgi:hypothetical protein